MTNSLKTGFHGCRYCDLDADGCTCKLDGLNVRNPAKGCKYRNGEPITNGDLIRAMTDEELAIEFSAGICDKVVECKYDDSKCTACRLEWLKEEVKNVHQSKQNPND